MEFFCDTYVVDYIDRLKSQMQNEIENLKDIEILSLDLDEYTDYYASKFNIDLIQLAENNIEKEIEKVKVKSYNYFYRDEYDEPRYYLVDGYKVIFKILFVGEAGLLLLRPSEAILKKFEVEDMKKPTDDDRV